MNEHLIRFSELNLLSNWALANLSDYERKKLAEYIINRIKEIVNQE